MFNSKGICVVVSAAAAYVILAATSVAHSVTGQISAPQKPSTELIEDLPDESTTATDSGTQELRKESVVSRRVHSCIGYNLIQEIDSYNAPIMTRASDKTFSSIAELQNAINEKSDHSGAVFKLSAGIHPFTGAGIDLSNRKNLTIYSDPNDRAVLDGNNVGNFGIHIRESSSNQTDNIQVIGFEIVNTRFHGIFVGGDTSSEKTGSNIYLGGNYIHGVGNQSGAGIAIRNSAGPGGIIIEGNELARIGLNGTGSHQGEGIYTGAGSNDSNYGSNITIRGNYFHDMNGEAIDIKRASREILIEYNKIDQIGVYSQGAITLAIDNLREQNYESNLVVRKNVISNVKKLAHDGNAIVVGTDSIVEGNVIFNIPTHAIDVYADATGTDKSVQIRENIIWNYVGDAIRENYGSGNGGPKNNFTVIRERNIVEAEPQNNECLGVSSDFLGPLENYHGFAPAM